MQLTTSRLMSTIQITGAIIYQVKQDNIIKKNTLTISTDQYQLFKQVKQHLTKIIIVIYYFKCLKICFFLKYI